ncbi:MAG: peptidoglycan recognition family protein [Candidatus Thiodiazotropha sp.]
MNRQNKATNPTEAEAETPPPLRMQRRQFLIGTGLLCGSLLAGGAYWGKRWKYIVVHHSAGSYGDIDFLRQVHKQRQPRDLIDAIPYHYVIGNGNGLGLGEIASDWRQELNLWGTHVSAHNVDRNFRGIGICLIGNFETDQVPMEQYNALVTLTQRLMRKYSILPGNVSGHGYIPDEATKCPGKNFPYDKFLADIADDSHIVAERSG